KFDWFSVPMLAPDDVMDPNSLPRRGNHAILEFKIFGALAESYARADRKLLVIRMEMRNPEILSIPFFHRIAYEPDGFPAHRSQTLARNVRLPRTRRSGFNQATEILLALAPRFL